MKIKKILGLSLAIVMGLLLVPLASNAVTISPPIIEIDAARGDVIKETLKVRNEAQTSVTYYLSSERFIAAGESGSPEFVGEDIGLATWINFNGIESITVPGSQTVNIDFTIGVPNYAAPGGHYAAVFLSTTPPKKSDGGSQVSIASKIGTLVLVKIAGEVRESVAMAEFTTRANTYNSLPVDFNIRVNNDGNIHVKPMGTILVKNMFGSVAGKVSVNEKGGNVLPGTIRKFEANWVKNANEVGATTFWGKYRQQKENYAFGKYTADLNITYGTAGKVLLGRTSFWVIPWHVIMVNLVMILIIILVLYLLVRKYNAWLLTKYAKASKGKKK